MENKRELIYVGYRFFNGKKDPDKTYYVLKFMTHPIVTENFAYCQDIDIFVDRNTYTNFIKENDLLDPIEVNYSIEGDKVKYYLD